MAIIQSGSSTTTWTIDPGSNAGRMTLYDVNGNPMDVSSLSNVLNYLNDSVTITLGGQATVGFNVGSTAGTITLSFEATIDNTTWFALECTPVGSVINQSSTSSDGQWTASVGGYYAVRARVSSFTIIGSMIVSVVLTLAQQTAGTQTVTGTVAVNQGTPNTLANAWSVEVTDGTNILGTSSHPVRTDTTGITTQPVSGTVTADQGGTWTVQPGNTPNTTPWLMTVEQGGNAAIVTASNALKVDGSAVTQPVSGTVTANAGTGSFNNDSVGVTASAPPADATYVGGLVTTAVESGLTTGDMYPLSMTTAGLLRTDGSNVTQPVSGTVTSNAGTGNFTVVQSTASNLNANVSGTVTSNIGTTNGLALDATLTGGTAKFEMYDGSNVIGTSSHPVRVDPVGTTTQPISGTVTANAGTGIFAVSGTVTSNIGTTNGLALDTSVNGILVSQGSSTSGEKGPLIQGAVTTSSPSYVNAQTSPLSLTTAGAVRTDASATTQPVSGTVTANAGTGNFTVVQATAANLNATVTGTVTSNIGTTNGLALDATLTGGTAKFEMYDGTNIIGTSAHPVRVDPTGATTQPISGTVTANAGTGTFTVSGTVTANAGTGNFTNASIGATASAPPADATYAGALVTTSPESGLTTGDMYPLNMSTTGLLRVDGSNATQPVSGTVTANQGGTWTVQPGNTPNTSPWLVTIDQGGNAATVTASNALKIDGSAVTQPVSGTVTANAGTGSFTVAQATAANLNATVTGTVTSNIGTTNGLALDTSVNGILVSQGSSTSGEKGPLIQGAVTTSSPSYVNAQTSPLSLTTAGAVRTDSSATTQPVSGTVTANAGTGSFTVAQATASSLNATIIGTTAAGSGASTGLVTIQGNASGTPIPITGSISATNPSISVTAAAVPGSATFVGGEVQSLQSGLTSGDLYPLSLTTGALLRVDGSNVTQPVSGTVTANAGTGTFTVSGTVTANAGTGSFNNASVGVTASAPPADATYVGGLVTTAVESGLTTGDMYPLSMTTAGLLRTDGSNVTQPVSGTVTANAGTGSFTVAQATAANLNATVTGTVTSNIGTTNGLALDATLTGGTAKFEMYDGSNVIGTSSHPVRTDPTGITTQPVSGTITANAGTGTFTVSGTVTANAGTGSFNNASVGVTASAPPADATYVGALVTTLAESGLTNGDMYPLNMSTTGLLRVDGSNATQPVSGTVTANIGTTNGLALDATLTGGTAKFEMYDGTNVIGTSAHPVRVDPTGATTQPVSGTVTANAGTGSFTVAQATAANLNATVIGTVTSNIGTTNGLALDTSVNGILVSQGSTTSGEKGPLIQGAVTTGSPSYTTAQTSPISLTTAGAVRTDASATTQPVSGTVTANAGTGNFTVVQATASNLNANVSGTVTATQGTAAALAAAWPVEITDGTNILGTSSHPVRTDPTGTTTQPVSGTVTANAGTGNFTVAQATAANLNATIVGNTAAGSGASSGLVTIQGNAGGTPVPITGTISATNPSVSTTATAVPASATFVGGEVQSLQSGLTSGDLYPLSLTTGALLRVDGSNVTQPVSGTVTANAGTGTFTVSGTVTANAGTGNFTVTQATAANLNATVAQGTSNTAANGWYARLTDGTNGPASVKPTNTIAAAADIALVVALSPASAAPKASTGTTTVVASSATVVTVLAANANRLGATISNSSTQILYVKFGSGAALNSYNIAVPITNGLLEVPFGYTGIITGISASANGSWYVCEMTV
jgi:hypothetical protein